MPRLEATTTEVVQRAADQEMVQESFLQRKAQVVAALAQSAGKFVADTLAVPRGRIALPPGKVCAIKHVR